MPSDVRADRTMAVLAILADGDIRLSVEFDAYVPYFGWVFNAPARASARSMLRQLSKVLVARATGAAPPPEPKHPWWAPPEAMTSSQVRTIATVSLLLGVAEYGSGLLTQTIDFVAKTYHASDAGLGVVTAVARVGNLVVLVGGVMADRAGRRRLLLGAVAVVLAATSLAALAPNLVSFGALQVFVSGGVNLAFLVGFIIALEEAPEASRTYTLAIVGIASGLGFVLGAILLPLADLAADAWRGLYALAVLGFLFIPSASRNLEESHRFEALRARGARTGRIGEVVDRRYGGRFVVMCVIGFLLNSFFAPQAQFTNRYLSDQRGFSGFGILILRAVTQALPSLFAAYAGGRLAESRGRRPMARWGMIVGAVTTAGFFLVGGPPLWLMLTIAAAAIAVAGPALSSFTTELFPTEVRGTAGAGLTITGVMGSATGLLLAGYLAKPLGSIGNATAVTSVGPLVVAIFLIRFLPEARGKLLDEVSPSEV